MSNMIMITSNQESEYVYTDNARITHNTTHLGLTLLACDNTFIAWGMDSNERAVIGGGWNQIAVHDATAKVPLNNGKYSGYTISYSYNDGT